VNNAEMDIFLPMLLGGFVMAFFTPALHRILKFKIPYFLSLIPLFYFIYFLIIAFNLPHNGARFSVTSWIEVLDLDLSFRFDGISLLFSLLISFFGFLIILYSTYYFKPNQDRGRFYALLLIFMVSMLGLVLADHLFVLFLFWELTTFSSFLLIGFDHQKKEARQSAWQAIIITTFGALAMLAGFIILGEINGDFNITSILENKDVIQNHEFFSLSLFLILQGAFTKSAQFPFSFWLPGAMSAPTPISAYLHSVTMVKAGIYLMARFLSVLGHNSLWFYSLTIIGSLTIITSALQAIKQDDLKLILAYFTLCALGVMTILLGVGTPEAIKSFAIFLLAHSCYKGSLFLAVGSIDHEAGTRKVSELRGLLKAMPKTSLATILSFLSMMALPATLGFMGKEMILKALIDQPYLLFIIASVIACNSCLVLFLLMNVFIRSSSSQKRFHESPFLWGPPLLLAFISLLAGMISHWSETLFMKSIISSISGDEVKGIIFAGIKFDKYLGMSALILLLAFILFMNFKFFKKVISFSFFKLLNFPGNLYLWWQSFILSLGRDINKMSLKGYYHRYMSIILLSSIFVLVYGLWTNKSFINWPLFRSMEFYEWGLVIVIVSSTMASILVNRLITSVMLLGVIGFCLAIIFVSYGAPDLALTQILIETLTIILFALIAIKFPIRSKHSFSSWQTKRDIVLSLSFGCLITVLLWSITSTPLDKHLSELFAKNSLIEGNGKNIVNVILVDFRALDTLGEVTVLFIAGLGFYSLLKLSIRKRQL